MFSVLKKKKKKNVIGRKSIDKKSLLSKKTSRTVFCKKKKFELLLCFLWPAHCHCHCHLFCCSSYLRERERKKVEPWSFCHRAGSINLFFFWVGGEMEMEMGVLNDET